MFSTLYLRAHSQEIADLPRTLLPRSAYQRHLNESRRTGKKEIIFTPTNTGRQQLRPGNYLVKLQTGTGAIASQIFTVQSLENRSR